MNNDKNNAITIIQEAEEEILEEEAGSEVVEVLPEVAKAKEETAAATAVTEATFKSTSVALIEKLLQFSTPRLDSKIVNVLFLEGKERERDGILSIYT